MEYDLVDGFAANDYIHGADIDLYEALNEQRGWVWNTEEIARMLEWMKGFRENGGQIDYYGIDVFDLIGSAKEALDFLEKGGVEEINIFEQQWEVIFQHPLSYFADNEKAFYDILTNEVDLSMNYQLQELLQLLCDLFEQHQSVLISTSSEKEWTIHRQLARTALIRSKHLLQFNMHYIFTEEDWQSEWAFYRGFGKKVDSLKQQLALVNDPGLEISLGGILEKVNNPYSGRRQYLTELNFQQRSDWKDILYAAQERIQIRKSLYLQHITKAAFQRLERWISDLHRLISSYNKYFDKPLERLNAREIGLAQNAAFLNSLDDKGTIIWAHNLHVTKNQTNTRNDGDKMGAFLKRQYDNVMLVVGTFVGTGSLQAWKYTDDGRQLSVFELDQPKEGSLEDLMIQTGCEVCLLDLRTLPEQGPVRDWFTEKHPFRSIGNYYDPNSREDFYLTDVITEHFDVIVFVRQTSRAEPTEEVKKKYLKK